MWACMGGYENIVDRLLNEKESIDVNRVMDKGINALMVACKYGKRNIVLRLLREKKVKKNINYRSEKVGTALSIAAESNHATIVELLESAGAKHT